MSQITIVGDGQMGLVLAMLLAEKGTAVRITGPFPDQVATLAKSRVSQRLPGLTLPARVEVVAEAKDAVDGADLLVNAIPTQFIRRVWEPLAAATSSAAIRASVAKGIEVSTLERPSEILAEFAPDAPLVVLSGPTIAAELARRLPATMVAASDNEDAARVVQELFGTSWMRIYTNTDPLGVELAGAAKNVIAIAAGIIDGLAAGYNAKSALLARGLSEIVRLGTAMGANVETFFGIAGVGDLATTCFSPEGRNRTCGERLGVGQTLKEVLDGMGSVVEGVETARGMLELARRHDIELPIMEAVHAILHEGLDPRDAITGLMGREQKPERIG